MFLPPVAQETLSNGITEEQKKRHYVLSLIATIKHRCVTHLYALFATQHCETACIWIARYLCGLLKRITERTSE